MATSTLDTVTVYRVNDTTLGGCMLSLEQPVALAHRAVLMPPPVPTLPARPWHARLWHALTRPRTLWFWRIPWC